MKIEKSESSKRNKTADLLKGIAVVLMIQVHIAELFLQPEIFQNTEGKIALFFGGPPAAPVFMVVMGYFLFLSKKSGYENVIRGVKLFLGGILLNIGLNFHLLIKIYSGEYNINPWHYIFGADILTLAGLSIVLLSAFKKIFKANIILYIILLLIIFVLSYFSSGQIINPDSTNAYVLAFLYGTLEWSYFPLIPWFIYPLAGFTFAIVVKGYKQLLKNNIILPVIFFSGVIVLYTFDYGYRISGDLQSYYHHNSIFVLWTFAFLAVFIFCVNYFLQGTKDNFLIKYFGWMGRNVTSAYVFQWLIIGNIATSVYKTQSLVASIYWFIGITTITSLLIYIYREFISEKIQLKFSIPLLISLLIIK